MDISIRLATASDAAVLARLRYAFRSSVGLVTEADQLFIQRCTLWMQKRLKESGTWKCWVAEREGELIGNLWMQVIEKIPNPTSESEYHAYLTNFYVREEWQGRGVGSSLFSAALTWVQTNHIHAVILWPTARSRPFYLRHGFSVREDLMELMIVDTKNEREK